uniref:Uncharacterized protein n=1 Tax=uncultured organism TaxID=155900 RepID=D8VN72_9ZZZZ|nr:hypothetical protein [uncultured organism]
MITLELELLTTGVELREELVVGMLDGADELVTVPEQILPVRLGISAEPPRLSTWNPKLILWPGCKLPFQLILDAE